jgi:transposase
MKVDEARRRAVVEGVLRVLVLGAMWKDLTYEYPSHQTCHFRTVVTRFDRKLRNYFAFVQLGCVLILLRRLVGKS